MDEKAKAKVWMIQYSYLWRWLNVFWREWGRNCLNSARKKRFVSFKETLGIPSVLFMRILTICVIFTGKCWIMKEPRKWLLDWLIPHQRLRHFFAKIQSRLGKFLICNKRCMEVWTNLWKVSISWQNWSKTQACTSLTSLDRYRPLLRGFTRI